MTDSLRDYVAQWLFRADEDIAVVNQLLQAQPQVYASSICFHAQQAVEKYLKALLAWKGVDFPRTHDVDFLLAECRKVVAGELDGIDLKNLTDFGVSIRYPDDFYVPNLSEATYYAQVAKEVRNAIAELIVLPPESGLRQ